MANVIRDPLFTPAPKRTLLGVDLIPNLLLTTLAVVAAVPFSPTDLPTPMRARAVPQAECVGTPRVLQSLFFYSPEHAPELQAPLRARAVPQADIPPNSLLTGIPAQPTVPFKNLEQLTQIARRPAQSEIPPNLLASTLLPAQGAPFYQTDWPNPVRARIAPQADSQTGVTTRGIPTLSPFAWFDWPTPARARSLPQADSGPVSPALLAFFQRHVAIDFPITLRQRAVPQADSFGSPLALLNQSIPKPFAQLEWPVTYRPKATPHGDSYASAEVLPAPTPVPFSQNDWPTPTRLRWAQTVDSLFNAPILAPLAAGPLPAIQEWPITIQRRYQQVEQAPTNLLLSLQQLAGPLVALQDWPLTYRSRHLGVDLPPNSTLYLPPPVVLPHSQYDWPNPVRARRGDPSDTVENSLIRIGHVTTTLTGSAYWFISSPARSFAAASPRRRFKGASIARTFKVLSSMPIVRFDIKDPAEAVRLTFDMTAQLAALPVPNTLLTGVTSVTLANVFGGDNSLAQNGSAALSASNLQAIVPVLGGLNENDYSVRVVMSTTDPLTILELTGILPVRSS